MFLSHLQKNKILLLYSIIASCTKKDTSGLSSLSQKKKKPNTTKPIGACRHWLTLQVFDQNRGDTNSEGSHHKGLSKLFQNNNKTVVI